MRLLLILLILLILGSLGLLGACTATPIHLPANPEAGGPQYGDMGRTSPDGGVGKKDAPGLDRPGVLPNGDSSSRDGHHEAAPGDARGEGPRLEAGAGDATKPVADKGKPD